MSAHLVSALGSLIHLIIQVYIYIIVIRSLLSFVGPLPYHPVTNLLRRLTDPVFRLVHRLLPFLVFKGIDWSPFLIIFLLYLADSWVSGLFFSWAGRLALAGG